MFVYLGECVQPLSAPIGDWDRSPTFWRTGSNSPMRRAAELGCTLTCCPPTTCSPDSEKHAFSHEVRIETKIVESGPKRQEKNSQKSRRTASARSHPAVLSSNNVFT